MGASWAGGGLRETRTMFKLSEYEELLPILIMRGQHFQRVGLFSKDGNIKGNRFIGVFMVP